MTKAMFITAALAAALLGGPALAQTAPADLFERHFWGEGTCNGQDLLPIMKVNWEDVPLHIVETATDFIPDTPVAPQSYIFAGDSTPGGDILSWGHANMLGGPATVTHAMPAGTAMLLEPGDHVDVHVGCYPAGIHFQVYLFVRYVK